MFKKITCATVLTILLIMQGCMTNRDKVVKQLVSVEKIVEISTELKAPESAVYDYKRDLVYVSNVNGSPGDRDGNGFILSCDLDGNMINRSFISGLNAPKGMAIYEDRLYVSDIDTLVIIDIESEKIISSITSPDALFLNDVAASSEGEIYLTDTWSNKIFKLVSNSLQLYSDSPKLDGPNGLTFDGDRLMVVSWGLPSDNDSGSLKKIEADGSVTRISGYIESLDGIEAINKGEYLITEYLTGNLHHVQNGVFTNIFTTTPGSADLEYVTDKELILIPQMSDDKLIILKAIFN